VSVFARRFVWALVAFFVLAVVGAAGYMLLEGASLDDAAYMSVITLTAVGYEEVFPLSRQGRSFTMGLLLGGISWMGVWFALITSFIVELDLTDALWRRRNMKAIEELTDHVIICGAGRTGSQVAEELSSLGADYVIVERDEDRIEVIRDALPDALVLEGDATHDQVLLDAGLLRAHGLVTCLSADSDNLFVCLSTRDLSATVRIVARAYEEESMDKLYRAGADHVVSPNVSSAIRMASVLLRPSVVSFLDVATRSPDLSLRMEQTTIEEGSPVAGRTLAEARIPQETGLIVIALRKKEEMGHGFVFNPVASSSLQAGDEVIVLGQEEQIARLRAYLAPA
jgi:voltage-gated potassium channel